MLSIFLFSVCFPRFFFSYQILPLLFYRLPYRRKAAEQLTFLSYLKNIELFPKVNRLQIIILSKKYMETVFF